MNGTTSLAYAGIMLLAGVAIPIMAAMSGAMGVRIGSPPVATAIVFGLAFLSTALFSVVWGMPRLSQFAGIPPYLYLGGLCVAFYGLSITFVGPRFGIANAIFCVLVGQIICAALIDHFGWLGAARVPLDFKRIAGIAVMIVGLLLARKA